MDMITFSEETIQIKLLIKLLILSSLQMFMIYIISLKHIHFDLYDLKDSANYWKHEFTLDVDLIEWHQCDLALFVSQSVHHLVGQLKKTRHIYYFKVFFEAHNHIFISTSLPGEETEPMLMP